MCLTPIKVKSVHYGEKVSQYIPCGHCDECRRREKSGWSFRLALELQKKLDLGWEIGFCTLTYNDEHLPHIPFECFADGNQGSDFVNESNYTANRLDTQFHKLTHYPYIRDFRKYQPSEL